MYMRVPFQTFLRFVDILLLIISNLPCTGTRDLVIECDPSKQYSTFLFLRPRLRSITRAPKKGRNKSSIILNVRRKNITVGKKNREKSKIETKRNEVRKHRSENNSTAISIHLGRFFDTIGSRWDDSRGDIGGAKHAARSLATGGTMLSFPECEMHFFQLPFADNRRGNHGLGAGSREDIRALAIR